jgi:hypothetical protein
MGAALFHRLSPFQNDGLKPCQRQHKGGKDPRRAEAYHHRSVGGIALGDFIIIGLFIGDLLVPKLFDKLPFSLAESNIHGIDPRQLGLLPGIQRALVDLQGADVRGAELQGLGSAV